MEAIMYETETVFRFESDCPVSVSSVRFSAGKKTVSLCCNKPMTSGTLPDILLLPDVTQSGELQGTFLSGTESIDMLFTQFRPVQTLWDILDDTFFEYRKNPDFSIFSRIQSVPEDFGCIVIEDTTSGVKALKEMERVGKGTVFAVESDISSYNPYKVPSLAAYIRDISYYIDLLGMYTEYDSWFDLISCMTEKGIAPPSDGSFTSKSAFLKSCRSYMSPVPI